MRMSLDSLIHYCSSIDEVFDSVPELSHPHPHLGVSFDRPPCVVLGLRVADDSAFHWPRFSGDAHRPGGWPRRVSGVRRRASAVRREAVVFV